MVCDDREYYYISYRDEHKSLDTKAFTGNDVQNKTPKSENNYNYFSASAEIVLDSRRDYHRGYYRRTRARRLERKTSRRWCAWLLAHLEWPVEPTPIYPKSYPIRRPTLHLPQRVR